MAKIEEIWYWIIGAEEKLPDNVIGYNINEEITKDASNVINANNQTTTGMAWLIYWVNAPKLLAKTSVIWADWWWGWWGGGSTSTSIINMYTSQSVASGGRGIFDTMRNTSSLAPEISVSDWQIYTSTWWTYIISYYINTRNSWVTSFDFISRNYTERTYIVQSSASWQTGNFICVTVLYANESIRSQIMPYWHSCSPELSITMVRVW